MAIQVRATSTLLDARGVQLEIDAEIVDTAGAYGSVRSEAHVMLKGRGGAFPGTVGAHEGAIAVAQKMILSIEQARALATAIHSALMANVGDRDETVYSNWDPADGANKEADAD